MASILTNTSAMVALQNLRTINKGLEDTQSMISTGKAISSARDNAAVWAISKVMESDAMSFKAINDSLNLGQSTVTVARQASETVTDLLTQMKEKIVAAQEENVDRSKLQDDVNAVRTYSVQDTLAQVPLLAAGHGLNVALGGWVGRDLKANDEELAKLSEVFRQSHRNIVRVIVGNEARLGNPIGFEESDHHLVLGDVEIPLNRPTIVFGRGQEADIQFRVPEVSRRHAMLRVGPGDAVIEDLGSKNGTDVNSRRLDGAQQLVSGDTIGIGATTMVYRWLPVEPTRTRDSH